MNPMLMALKKKMDEHKGSKPDLEIDIEHKGENDKSPDEHSADDDVAGPAPKLEHEPPTMIPGEHGMEHGDGNEAEAHQMMMGHDGQQAPYEGSDLHMSILKGLGDHGVQGRTPMGLKERAAAGAQEKMAAMEAMKKKKGM